MSASKPVPVFTEKTFGFGLRAMKKFPELIPLVSILGFACAMAGSYMAYSLYQKPDVMINKSNKLPPWERVNPETPQTLMNFSTTYEKIPELEQLKKEIGSYKY